MTAFVFGEATYGQPHSAMAWVHEEFTPAPAHAYICLSCRPFFFNRRLFLAHWWYSPEDATPKVLQGISRVDTRTLQVASQSYLFKCSVGCTAAIAVCLPSSTRLSCSHSAASSLNAMQSFISCRMLEKRDSERSHLFFACSAT